MPTNIVEVDEFTTNVPVPENADDVDADASGAFRTGRQALANRTKYLKELVVTNGVRKLRRFANTTALRAFTGMSHGDVAIIDTDTYLGLYIYDTTVSGANDNPWALKPDGFSDGTVGRWRHLFNSFGASGSNGRWFLPPARHFPSLPDFVAVTSPGSATLTFDGSGVIDAGIESSTLTVQESDVVQVRAELSLNPDDTLGVQALLMKSENGGAYAAVADSASWIVLSPLPGTTRTIPTTVSTQITVGAGVTSVKFKVRLGGAAAATVTRLGPMRISSTIIRP